MLLPRVEPDHERLNRFSSAAELRAATAERKARFAALQGPIIKSAGPEIILREVRRYGEVVEPSKPAPKPRAIPRPLPRVPDAVVVKRFSSAKLDELFELIAKTFDMPQYALANVPHLLYHKRRRWLVMVVALRLLDAPYKAVADKFGLNHATAYNADAIMKPLIDQIDALMPSEFTHEQYVKVAVEQFTRSIYSKSYHVPNPIVRRRGC